MCIEMIGEEELGKRIKEFRHKSKLTLNSLAQRAGISQGYLSKIENSKNAPPVSTLLMINRALGISMSELFGEKENRKTISLVRKKERPFVARDGSVFGYNYQALAHKYYSKHFDPYIMTISADSVIESDFHFQHKGEEMLFVLSGKMRFMYGGEEYKLNKGDCIFFDANVPHHGYSLDGKDVECLMAIYTPEAN